jgi:hypothetical protein
MAYVDIVTALAVLQFTRVWADDVNLNADRL